MLRLLTPVLAQGLRPRAFPLIRYDFYDSLSEKTDKLSDSGYVIKINTLYLRGPMTVLSWRLLRLPLLLILLWWLLLFALYRWTVQREDEYATGLARIQTATFFASIVHTRDWNANNGGVWVRETPDYPANPWLPENERTLRTESGQTLVKVNPAYMTRQIAESFMSTMASFRISSLSPKRPGNRADQWETAALLSFEEGKKELFELTPGKSGAHYRYMAPLRAKETCLSCHQDKKLGDVLGGISVTINAEPILAAAAERKQTTGLAFGLIGMVGMIGIGGATFQINRKKELAEAANRAKSAFLANMTHDMRTPLTGILGMTELLERETRDSRHRYLLANLREATDSLLRVVDGILRYSLLEADRLRIRSAPFSLRKELDSCIAAVRPACESEGIQLSLVCDPSVPDTLNGDAFRLRQALGNLLGNAVKFTEKGSVTLRVALSSAAQPQKDGQCALSFQIIDTGIGIPREEQERIFESFEQGKTARQGEGNLGVGVGLGLAIARGIARRFGGDLTLSSAPGMGSVFTLTAVFPLAAEEEPAPLPPEPEKADEETAHQGRLVVAEDTSVTALFLHETLSGAGYAVHTASCGEDALFLIRKIAPDAVLLDMRLPDMSGLDIARRIRNGGLGVPSRTPILVLTATLGPADEEAFRQVGIDGWLLKPVQTGRLVKALADLFRPASGENVPAAEPQTVSAVFDARAALDDLGTEALLSRLANIFINEAPKVRAGLAFFAEHPESLPERAPELRRQAHSLKNGAGMLHLERLRAVCAELEEAATGLLAETLSPLARAAVEALDEATDALQRHGGA